MKPRTFRLSPVTGGFNLHASIALVLFIEVIAFLAGILFLPVHVHVGSGRTVNLALLSLLAAIAGNLFVWKMILNTLRPVKRVEEALLKLAESADYAQIRQQIAGFGESNSHVQACNLLISKLEAAESRKYEFINKFAHDLRSPLASVLGYADLLSEPGFRSDEQLVEKSVGAIKKQGKQICQLIDDVQNAWMAEKCLSEDDLRTFQLPELLEKLLQEIRQQTKREVFFENMAGEVYIIGDATGLRKMIMYVIDNGIKYSDPDQPVYVGLTPGKTPDFIEISVRDNGIGIDKAEQERVFLQFSRIRNDFTSRIPGAGLGLFIVKNIVRQHKGDVSIESQPGAGSTFRIRLPVSFGNLSRS